MSRLSKKAKQEWNFFINPKTGSRTYSTLCRKCGKECKQSFKAVIVSCPKYRSKRSVKKAPRSDKFNDECSKDEAIVAMVDSNIHREHLLPSEKAFAYKMKLEALKHQRKTYGQVVHKSRDNISDT